MIKYKLAELIRRLRRLRYLRNEEVQLPPIEESPRAKAAYLRALRAMLRELGRAARSARDEFALRALNTLADNLSGTAEQMVQRILRLEAERHTSTFLRTARRTLGIDLSSVVKQEDLGEYLAKAGLRNSALIKGLADDTVKRVQNTVLTAMINGTPSKELSQILSKDLGISDRRARLISRDQLAKMNSDMNRIRHEQAGVTHYRWSTSQDERVRPRHRSLDGSVYKYGEPTGAEDGLPPGQPINCRCVAIGIVKF